MEETSNVYRIRTKVGDNSTKVIHVPLNQTYDTFEILSLKLNQTNSYKTYSSDYGVIVGRVQANGGVGVPNAKISIFIEVSNDESSVNKLLYNFSSVNGTDNNGVRYNLLPDFVDDSCHQDVGTFPNKRLVLDNQDIIEIFDKYWKYTTTSNSSGDYMLFGIPTGQQQLHVDVDLSDCGFLSQRPRNMMAKGYNETMFESPNKFKSDTNLNSLVQIVSQDKGLYVYPYWGDTSDSDETFAITRCDINLDYKFEPSAVFIGSIVTDQGSNAIGKNCTATKQNGKMSELIAGEGTIEMIRKTLDNKVEEYPIKGNRLIDSEGVWAYDIPMNLSYVKTDEFGNLVPTDNPEKGIATRARVRFRIKLDENPNDASARKRAMYLVPNNPRLGDTEFDIDTNHKPDYEFGSATREESFCDLFWNKVYTVKNYIPKLQKNNRETNRKHTGIKWINNYGDNNPFPYNGLTIKLGFTYRLVCVITKLFINLVELLNGIISALGAPLCWLGNLKLPLIGRPFKKLLDWVPNCVSLSSDFCDDGINPNVYYPGCSGCVWDVTRSDCQKEQSKKHKEEQKICTRSTVELENCVENELASQNEATSFNFYNDWVNGVLYAPLWHRKITAKKKFFFGLFRRKAKDEWCSDDKNFDAIRILQPCAVTRDLAEEEYSNFEHKTIIPYKMGKGGCGSACQKSGSVIYGMNGVIRSKETMLGQTVYYYKPVEYDVDLAPNGNLYSTTKPSKGEIKLLFATDIVLLGSLNECDINGIPQFFKTLESSTYRIPEDLLFTDHEIINEFNPDGTFKEAIYTETSEMAGCDWGNKNEYGKNVDSGLFYGIGCSSITLMPKSCINLIRMCEYGVSLDETRQVPNMDELENDGDAAFKDLITDGFVSWDELYNLDERSMFATMNGNRLKTKLNANNGLKEYDFRYLYTENFDGSLSTVMKDTTKKYDSDVTYRYNHKLEQFSRDYYIFRMGNAPYYYDENRSFPRYENSFYFYFGLKAGKTAIEKFNSKYFAECSNADGTETQIKILTEPNTWCKELFNNKKDGYVAFDFGTISTPYDLLINRTDKTDESLELSDIEDEKIIFYDTISEEKLRQFSGYIHVDEPMLNNGSYEVSLTDNDGNIQEFTFEIQAEYLTFKTDVQDFLQGNNLLYELHGNSYVNIANDNKGKELDASTKQVTRDIGGVITVRSISYNSTAMDNYSVRIEPQDIIKGYGSVEFTKLDSVEELSKKGVLKVNDDVDFIYGIGVSKGDVSYKLTITELCYDEENDVWLGNGNTTTKKLVVSEPFPYKMYINGVDYDLIKNFNKVKINENETEYSNGWEPSGCIYNKNAKLVHSDRTITFANNPWFNLDNIWANGKFDNIESINSIESEMIEEDIKTFIESIKSKDYKLYSQIFKIKTITEVGENWFDTNVEEHTSVEADLGKVVVDATGSLVYNEEGDKINIDETKKKISNNTVTLNELLEEFTKENVGNNVYYTWSGKYIIDEFKYNSLFNPSVSEYNQDNIEDLVSIVNGFIEEVNEIIMLKNTLPSLMKDAFYLTCDDETKNIYINTETSDLPVGTILVYQEESTSETEDTNILTTNNMIQSYENSVDNIGIPTITYACHEKYGIEGSTTYEPVVAKYKGKYNRHAFYVGVMDDAKNSIPKKVKDGVAANLEAEKYNGLWYIKDNQELKLLFDFPIIDKSMRVNYIAWAYVDKKPYFENYDAEGNLIKDEVTLNGLFAAEVYNGKIEDNRYETQTLGGLQLSLSNNLANPQETYVEKRLVQGYDVDENGNIILNVLNNITQEQITQDFVNQINDILGTKFITTDNALTVFSEMFIENGHLVYYEDDELKIDVNIKDILDKFLNFTNYIVDENVTTDITQYASLSPIESVLSIGDEDGCQISNSIFGGMTIELEEAINDCRSSSYHSFTVYASGVNSSDLVYYSVFPLFDDYGNKIYEYPLNYAKKNDLVFSINEKIKDVFKKGQEYNIFSYIMTSDHFRGGDNYGSHYYSKTAESTSATDEEMEKTWGYGTTGVFIHGRGEDASMHLPVYVIAETLNHCRAISPVYDFRKVYVNMQFGPFYNKDLMITENKTTHEKKYEVIENTSYKLGVYTTANQYYVKNYEYTLSAEYKHSNAEVYNFAEQMLTNNKVIFAETTESVCINLENAYDTTVSDVDPYMLENFKKKFTATVVDYVGITHLTDCGNIPQKKSWYEFSWYANIPNGAINVGIKIDGGISLVEEDVYVVETALDNVKIYDVVESDKYKWIGWSENKPLQYGETPITDWSTIVNGNGVHNAHVFVGNWTTVENNEV